MEDGKVVFKYEADLTGINRGSDDADKRIKSKAKESEQAVRESAKRSSSAVTEAAEKTRADLNKLKSAYERNSLAIKDTDSAIGSLARQMKKLEGNNPEIAKETAEYKKLEAQLGDLINKKIRLKSAEQDLKTHINDTTDKLQKQEAAARGAGGGLSKLGETAKSVGKAIASTIVGALIAAATALIGLGKRGLELASDLSEVQNVVDVTFGDGKDKIDAFADSADVAFGLSELQVKRFTGTMGAMLKSMQVADDQSLKMSVSLVGLAGDMASFYNLKHEDAWEKIRSGIAGETEPLKQLGINMSVANLEAYALSQGITTAYEAMTEAEKVTLRYNYLMSVTADAQGDFARTSDGWANQLRIAKNNVDSLAASFGETLLPALQPVLKAFNDVAVPKLQEAFDKMASDGTLEKLGEALGKIAGLLGDTLAELLPVVIELLSQLLPPIADLVEQLLPPLLDVIKLINPLVEELMVVLGPLIKMLGGSLATALGVVADALSIVVGLIGALVEGIKSLLGQPNKFDLYVSMIEKPFTKNGSTYKAMEDYIDGVFGGGYFAQDSTVSGSIGGGGRGTVTNPDSELTDQEWYDKYMRGNAKGTSFWKGGRTWLHERGPEIYDLPMGTRVYPAELSAMMVQTPSASSRTETTTIGAVNVYPDSAEYARILALLEASDRAQQNARAAGNGGY